jgi:hypothetical protein
MVESGGSGRGRRPETGVSYFAGNGSAEFSDYVPPIRKRNRGSGWDEGLNVDNGTCEVGDIQNRFSRRTSPSDLASGSVVGSTLGPVSDEEARPLIVSFISLLPNYSSELFSEVVALVEAERQSRNSLFAEHGIGDGFIGVGIGSETERGAGAYSVSEGVAGVRSRAKAGDAVDLSDTGLYAEVEGLIRTIRSLHKHFMSGPGGAPREDMVAREAIALIAGSSNAISNLVKYRERVHNVTRIAALERAVVEVLKKESPELQDKVMAQLERELAHQE